MKTVNTYMPIMPTAQADGAGFAPDYDGHGLGVKAVLKDF